MTVADDLIVDLTNYKDRVGNRVVPGRYSVIVEDAEPDTAKSGNQMVNLWLRVQGGEFDGATIVDRLVLTDKSLFRVVGFLQAIGLPTPRKRFKINARAFVGRTLDIDVEDGDPYNGRVKSEVRGYMRSIGGNTSAAADLDDVSDLPTDGGDSADEIEIPAGGDTDESSENPWAADSPQRTAEPTALTGAADPAASPRSDENPSDIVETDEIDLDKIDL